MIKGKNITLGITGSISAYKAVELASRLIHQDARIYTVMTKAAMEFIRPAVFRAISGMPVLTDLFSRDENLPHIKLADWMDILVITPATANIIGKIACGIADDLLTSVILASYKPIIIAPAMNDKMYQNKAVQNNIDLLKKRGYHFIGPEEGVLASGKTGNGRLAGHDKIITEIDKYLK